MVDWIWYTQINTMIFHRPMVTEKMSSLLIWLFLPSLSRAFYFSKFVPKPDQCTDFKVGGAGGLGGGISQFSTGVPRPVRTAGKQYKFGCRGGEVRFCSVSERVDKTCPKISIDGKREVWGKIKIPPFHYTLRDCQFGEDGSLVGGDVEGRTEGAHINFRIVSMGVRRICDLSTVKIRRNLLFFPSGYFTRMPDHHRSMNLQAVREAVVKSVNENVAKTIQTLLSGKYECDSFFRTTK